MWMEGDQTLGRFITRSKEGISIFLYMNWANKKIENCSSHAEGVFLVALMILDCLPPFEHVDSTNIRAI